MKNKNRGLYDGDVYSSKPDSGDLSRNPLVIGGKVYLKHQRHWYEEGNIAFLVERAAFRLHGSVLSRRSTVMADLMNVSRHSPSNSSADPDNQNIIIGGVPFVVLRDKKAKDFAHVLDFIYPNTLPAVQTKHLDVHDLMGMVRLAGEYLIHDLLEWAVSKLGDEFLLRPDHRSFAKALKDEERYSDPEFCVKVIQFSRECSLPQFLPLALYALATKDWSARHGAIACLQQLSREDQYRIHEGRVALTKEVFKKAFTMPENHGAAVKCKSWSCSYIKPTMWFDARERWENLMLYPLEELEHRLSLTPASLCKECITMLRSRTLAFRDRLVQQLTNLFMLD
ncbi:hypothetical protein FRC00_012166 [Tulasnella sp. 408]|nr:hypothetical protein FRC00_012166 [Tulasnella sp. 408]